MTVHIIKNTVTVLSCDTHGLNIQHNPMYHGENIFDYLEKYGWGYEYQNEITYYCPVCLKNMGLGAGKVDIRSTIVKI